MCHKRSSPLEKPISLKEAKVMLAECDPPCTISKARTGDYRVCCGKAIYFTNDLMDATTTGLIMSHEANK